MSTSVHRLPVAMVEKMTGLRRRIHERPELSNREHQTQKLVAEQLESVGISGVRTIAGTGSGGRHKWRESG